MAGSCRQEGSQAVLLEIEELGQSVGGCHVEASGCLGLCSKAPNALVEETGGRDVEFTRITTPQLSAEVILQATGKLPDLKDEDLVRRLEKAQKFRIGVEASKEWKWNAALRSYQEGSTLLDDLKAAEADHVELLRAAGFHTKALDELNRILMARRGSPSFGSILWQAELFGKLGRLEDVMINYRKALSYATLGDLETREYVTEKFSEYMHEAKVNAAMNTNGIPADFRSIENYASWRLDTVEVVSKWSAVFHFSTEDKNRGSPITRSRRGRTLWRKTWHVTLLAMVGENKEGPLPWVERDYTPISTAKEWEEGKCSILIKVYRDGLGTQWLHNHCPVGSEVWLSKPKTTLRIPNMVPEADIGGESFLAAGFLLVVGGSGVVVAWQILQHCAERGLDNRALTVVYSCRVDDILLIPGLLELIREKKLHRLVLFLTEEEPLTTTTPFLPPAPAKVDYGFSEPELSDKIIITNGRVSKRLLENELTLLQGPSRIVISGPQEFNKTIGLLAREVGNETHAITLLSA